MVLKVLNSNSLGNCYILENDHEALILECGVQFERVKKALNFNYNKVAGALLTHNHGDHAKFAKEFARAGIDIFSTAGTFGALKFNSHRCIPITKGETFMVNKSNFKVVAFSVMHDVPDPVGFLINHPDTGNVLFITDTYYVPNTFRGLNNIMIEANYSNDILQRRLEAAKIHGKVRDRVLESHMEIGTTCNFLKANDISDVNNIVLIHLSDGNSNAAEFKSIVQHQTNKQVHIATAGLTIPFLKHGF